MTTILVVDDNVVDRRIAGGFAEAEKLTPIFAEDGHDALGIIEKEPPDVVLTDLQMPGMDGLELVRQIRRKHSSIPVILMTAHGSEEVAVQALHAGAASYVPKKNMRRNLGEALAAVMSAVAASQQRNQVRQFLESSESRFVLGYEPGGSQALISYFRDGLNQLNFCDESSLLQLSTALTEALSNAIEHGNLELDSDWREREDQSYHSIGARRATEPPYRDRRVRVTTRLGPEEVSFRIEDEGPGFDPTSLPDPTDPENLLKPSGRGIMLIRTFLDEVRFNDKGNVITMIKRRLPE